MNTPARTFIVLLRSPGNPPERNVFRPFVDQWTARDRRQSGDPADQFPGPYSYLWLNEFGDGGAAIEESAPI